MKRAAALALFPVAAAFPVERTLPAQTAAPTVITACVSKYTDIARIVPGAAACFGFETVVTWNKAGVQGPDGVPGQTGPTGPQGIQGPAGPQGPSGLALAHIVPVPANGTPAANGLALTAALGAIGSSATAAQPYLIQLDAGTYTLPYNPQQPGTLLVPSFISIKGAGMKSTVVNARGPAFTFYNTDGSPSTFSLSDLTVTSDTVMFAQNMADVLIDHVQGNGYFVLGSHTPQARLLITDSLITGPLELSSADATSRYKIIGTEVYAFFNPQPLQYTAVCLATYDPNLAPYPASCVSYNPSNP